MKHRIITLCLVAAALFFVSSCSKKDSPTKDGKTAKTFKMVIKSDDAFSTSDPSLSLTISGVDQNEIPVKYAADYSKEDDDNISLTETDVIAHKSITITSLNPVVWTDIAFGCSAQNVANPTQLDITVFYDDKQVDEQHITLTNEDVVKVWKYNAE